MTMTGMVTSVFDRFGWDLVGADAERAAQVPSRERGALIASAVGFATFSIASHALDAVAPGQYQEVQMALRLVESGFMGVSLMWGAKVAARLLVRCAAPGAESMQPWPVAPLVTPGIDMENLDSRLNVLLIAVDHEFTYSCRHENLSLISLMLLAPTIMSINFVSSFSAHGEPVQTAASCVAFAVFLVLTVAVDVLDAVVISQRDVARRAVDVTKRCAFTGIEERLRKLDRSAEE